MKKIELQDFGNNDFIEETEITCGDWLHLHVAEDGEIGLRVASSGGEYVRLSFNAEGKLRTLIQGFV